ncbi:hypothetical protein CRG98_001751 [Punica granatum]|uniref:Uncharacterized protein n=1 Tax=Punica granatum TaxID=22663 RepID=A0A2I0LB00_PUNGR|nr:hypothetical protein CRG98_001751 [Punica granatum]
MDSKPSGKAARLSCPLYPIMILEMDSLRHTWGRAQHFKEVVFAHTTAAKRGSKGTRITNCCINIFQGDRCTEKVNSLAD